MGFREGESSPTYHIGRLKPWLYLSHSRSSSVKNQTPTRCVSSLFPLSRIIEAMAPPSINSCQLGFLLRRVLMELASFMKYRGMRAIVEWAPRECNREADMLANGDTSLFDP